MEKVNFEDGIKRIELIINRLEGKDVPLEEALNLFKEGIGLINQCNKELDSVEKQMQILLEGEDGELKLEEVILEQTVLFQEG